MISSPTIIMDHGAAPLCARPANVGRWLSLAAAPTFAIMALLTGLDGDRMPDMLCSAAGHGLPPSGMFVMYVLMSAFHLPPWLKLVSANAASLASPLAQGNRLLAASAPRVSRQRRLPCHHPRADDPVIAGTQRKISGFSPPFASTR